MTDTTAPVAETPAALETVQPEFAAFTDPNEPKSDPAPKDDAPKSEDAPKPEGEGDPAPAAEDKPGEQPKPKQTAQERIGEVTRLRREAERERDEARRELAALKAPKTETPERSEPATDGEPDPTTYDYGEADPKYIRDLATYTADKRFDERQRQADQSKQVQEVDRSWETAQAAARSKYADYDEVVTAGANEERWPCTPAMAHAIKTSETGPDVAYHLASHPDEARRIAGMNEFSQIREMGKLEASLATPPTKEPPKGKTATDAPPPPDGAARGAGGKFVVSDDTEDFKSFETKHFPQK